MTSYNVQYVSQKATYLFNIVNILALCLCMGKERRPDKPLDNAQSNRLNRQVSTVSNSGGIIKVANGQVV